MQKGLSWFGKMQEKCRLEVCESERTQPGFYRKRQTRDDIGENELGGMTGPSGMVSHKELRIHIMTNKNQPSMHGSLT